MNPKPDSRSFKTKNLADIRKLKMARSAQAYVRGSTVSFYKWLQALETGAVPQGPAVWICGDCHVGNLGPVANAESKIAVQIRDLDQTVIGNPAHDLVRLGLSLASAARGFDLSGVTTAQMIEQLMDGYQHAFDADEDAAAAMPECIRIVMRKSAKRTWANLACERIEDEKPTIPLGKNFWPLENAEREEITSLFSTDRIKALATSLRSRDDDAKVEFVDAAYWVKGCSSLGLKRYAVLLSVGNKPKDTEFCLMDIKEAVRAAAPQYRGHKMPNDEAERIIQGARHLSPYLGERMAAAEVVGKAVFIRELLPQDLKITIAELSAEDAMKTAYFLASVVGRAHARQMASDVKNDWQRELEASRPKVLGGASWLWSAIVELLAIHEKAYLEHCRECARLQQ
jgi:uncharacterized protein (DUF2252 family)